MRVEDRAGAMESWKSGDDGFERVTVVVSRVFCDIRGVQATWLCAGEEEGRGRAVVSTTTLRGEAVNWLSGDADFGEKSKGAGLALQFG